MRRQYTAPASPHRRNPVTNPLTPHRIRALAAARAALPARGRAAQAVKPLLEADGEIFSTAFGDKPVDKTAASPPKPPKPVACAGLPAQEAVREKEYPHAPPGG